MILDLDHPPCVRCGRCAPIVQFASCSGAVCLQCIARIDAEKAQAREALAAIRSGYNRPTQDGPSQGQRQRSKAKLREYDRRRREKERERDSAQTR